MKQISIHKLAAAGNTDEVARLLADGTPVDIRDERTSQTPLMCAVNSPAAGLDMLRLLVEHGADVDAVGGEYPRTVLGIAVGNGDIEKTRFLIESGVNVLYQQPSGYNVLIDAMHGHSIVDDENLIATVTLLIQHGADVNQVSDYNESALRVASNNGRFDVVKVLLNAGADLQQLEWTTFMTAVAFGRLEEIERCLKDGADLSSRDYWNCTPWLLSLQTGDIKKCEMLLAAGANRNDRGRCGKPALHYPIRCGHTHVLQWLLKQGFDTEAQDEFGTTPLILAAEEGQAECVKLLLQAGAQRDATDHIERKAIEKASTIEVVRVLVEAGDDLNDIDDEVRARLTGVEYEGELETTEEEYRSGKEPRFGQSNPQLMNIPCWKAMIRSGVTAWIPREMFNDTNYSDESPVWCYHRFGKSLTELPDGRFIEIGGEHEDFYDPDFCIYNDVVVHHGGGKFDIFGYPEGVFPPTDFHSATLVGNDIYIIGCLGYPEDRKYGETPVYRLNCQTFAIEKLKTSGQNPGWIHKHKARLISANEICIKGGEVGTKRFGREDFKANAFRYILDLEQLRWRRLDRKKSSPTN